MENIFQRPPILMRLTMLTRDKMSLLRAASLRTARETAHSLNDRKQKEWVEAGILPLNYSRSVIQVKYRRFTELTPNGKFPEFGVGFKNCIPASGVVQSASVNR